ncbi:amidinotransferase [Saccharothrix violaceirubra]|uniref:N-dimethylarginine dimethylaminohydrolase n=1 Tax=Saccharothrix violaceirubra TaxID=413306 RepID=A0A7W7T296_9PSEU|nr:scyllo-inosamine-4-phosphate amidinotransferase [Saccharothrix violaceirubra]MBB4965211.1 N-dimethylarginine dimethylaminohydrolase [Saccharothrix violaceirubra]
MTVGQLVTGHDGAATRPAVHSWDEFTALHEVVVGDATGAHLPDLVRDRSAWLNYYPDLDASSLREVHSGLMPRWIVDETNEDLAGLVEVLEQFGVTVRRPAVVDHAAGFGTPEWSTTGFSCYCPRDLTLVVGSTLIETPSPARSRYFEQFGLRPLFQDYLRQGATWLAAPRPRLADELFPLDADGLPYLGEAEAAFEAANVLRLGRDVLYQVSRSGNEAGLRWLESTLRLLGDVRVHPLRDVYGYTHIDSTIAFLRPGLVLLNPSRITPAEIPAPLAGWDVVWCPPVEDRPMAAAHGLSGPWISMNLLMLDERHAVVDADQPALLRALERHGITVVPHRLRHQRVLGGGFHCVTLDVVRAGGPENYLD